MQNPHSKGGFIKVLGLLLIILFVGVGIFMLTSESFEKESPQINLRENSAWNLKDFFPIQIQDNAGITVYSVTLLHNQERIPLQTDILTAQIHLSHNADLSES